MDSITESDAPPSSPVRPQLRHVGVYATNLDLLADFYGRMLGLIVSDRGVSSSGDELVFMTASPEQHHQLVLVAGRDPDTKSTVNQLSFRLDSLDDLRSYVRFLKTIEGLELRELTHGNAWSVYYADPEGNRVEVYCDSPWYVTQPCGIPMDLSESVESTFTGTADLVERDPSAQPVDEWRRSIEQRLTESESGATDGR
jgi:catechol 2,3-dioxygenase